ncbi:choline dehydrogenase [Mycobacterium avium]|nr:choline dehydrogenase [Mycobacterium avium]
MSQRELHDVVVVGAGTAGSVVAARLTEDSTLRVLLLETGSARPPRASITPPAWPTLLQGEASWGDVTTVQTAIGRAVPFARGRGIGGSSTINAMVFARGHRDSYSRWRDNGAAGWSFDELLPYFKRSESTCGKDPSLRGQDGPMAVAPAAHPNPVLVACLCAAIQQGYPRAADISGGLEVGFGFTDLNIVDGKRQSAADAYLLPALDRPNLEFQSGATVHRLRIRGSRCTGVEYTTAEGRQVTAAAREIILCAGAIGSPHLLLASGIGPPNHLRSFRVDVALELPGVGANLQDHPIVPLVYRAARPVPAGRYNHGELLGLIRRHATGGPPEIQIFGVDSADVPGLGGADGYVLGVSVMQPVSRGRVGLSGPTIQEPPAIDPNYLSDDRDMGLMIEGLRIGRKIGMSQALDPWRAEELAPGDDAVDDAALRSYIQRSVASYFHPVGTCAMGTGPESVVDNQLRLHGIDNLRVIDASVMPSLPSNNTAATVYAIAERGADLVRLG